MRVRVTMRLKILVAPVIVVVLLVGMGFLAYSTASVLATAMAEMAFRDDLAYEAQLVQTEIVSQASALRMYLIRGQDEDLSEFRSTGQEVQAELDRLIGSAEDQSTRTRLESIKADNTAYMAVVDEVVPLIRMGDVQRAEQVLASEATPLVNRMRETADSLVAELRKHADDTRAEADAAGQRLRWAVIGITAAAALIGLIVSVLISRSLTMPIRRLSQALTQLADGDFTMPALPVTSRDEVGQATEAFNTMLTSLGKVLRQVEASIQSVTSASDQLSSAAQSSAQAADGSAQAISQVAAGSNEQAQSITHIKSVVEELRSAIQQIADGATRSAAEVQDTAAELAEMVSRLDDMASKAAETAEQSKQGAQRAQAGANVVNQSLKEMTLVNAEISESAERLKELESFSSQIGAISEVISSIADQTNLLALNAAIEAARAGEHGRGFAVVAEEVRKLAERSSSSAREITALIHNIQDRTSVAVRAMDKSTERIAASSRLANEAIEAMRDILNTLEESVKDFGNLAQLAETVKTGAKKAVQTFNEVAAVTEESTAAAEEMSNSVHNLMENMKQIAQISEANAAATQEVSASVEELTAAAEEVASSAESLMRTAREMQKEIQAFRL